VEEAEGKEAWPLEQLQAATTLDIRIKSLGSKKLVLIEKMPSRL
jgi:hypothetical protein